MKLFTCLNRFPSFVYQGPVGGMGMRVKIEEVCGMTEISMAGCRKKKPLEEAGFAQFEQCVFDSWDAVSRVARLEATET